jgi:hypothetical protein
MVVNLWSTQKYLSESGQKLIAKWSVFYLLWSLCGHYCQLTKKSGHNLVNLIGIWSESGQFGQKVVSLVT